MASSGTIKSWVLNTGTISGNSCAGAYYSFEWTSSKKSAGVTTVSWNLYGRGRTSSPTKLENEIYLDVVKNGATTRLYTLSDSNGTEQTSFKNYLRTSGSFDVTHSNGAGSFTINMKVAIYTGSYHSTSETATLDANYHNYTVSYNANGGSGAPSAQTKVHGTNLTLSSTKPTIGNTVTYPTGTITISYNSNGSTATAPASGTGTYTNTKSQPRTFNVWNTNSSGTGTSYSAGGTYSSNASVTLYAQYKNNGSATETRTTNPSIKTASAITRSNDSITGYKVTFNSNGSSATAPNPITSTKTRKYTFGGWNTNTSGTGTNYSAATSYTFSASDTLYAKWTSSDTNNAITLPAAITRSNSSVSGPTVSFSSNGSSVTAPTAIASTKTRKYTFGGWNTKSDGSGSNYAASSSYTPSAAITLYAKWTTSDTQNAITLPAAITRPNGSAETGYKVTFNSNGSSATAPSAVTSTKTPKYAFAGWNTAADGSGTNYSAGASYTPSGAITLYAKWTKTYQNNAITLPSSITRSNSSVTGYKVTFNVPSTVTSPDPITSTKTRKYTFGGWNTNTSGTGTNYSAGASYTPSAATTLYAKWTSSDTADAIKLPAAPTRPSVSATPYTVTFDANGGSCSTASLSAARTTSYTFNKWNTASDGSGESYSAGGSYTPSAATTLYSTWNSSTSTSAVTLPTPTRSNYTFKGWSTSSTATSGTTGSYTPSGNVTLYATWTPQYIIQFNINGGSGSVPSTIKKDGTSTSVVMGDITSTVPTRTGYVFRGWSASSTYSSKRIAYGTSSGGSADYSGTAATTTQSSWTYANYCTYTGGSSSSTTLTLYAQWEKLRYTVSYDANGGTGAPSPQAKIHGSTLTLSSTIPTKSSVSETFVATFDANGGSCSTSSLSSTRTTSYSFADWNTQLDFTGDYYSAGSSYTNNAPLTLYARWNQNSTTTSVTLPTPTRTGYRFQGWMPGGYEILPSYILDKQNKLLIPGAVEVAYVDMYDNGPGSYDPGWMFNWYSYAKDNHDHIVPVLYKTSEGYELLGCDTAEPFYHIGKNVVEGETYDCWKKIEEDGTYTWDSDESFIIYTNEIVDLNVSALKVTGSFTLDHSTQFIAVWEANTYTVQYRSTYGTGSTASSSHSYGTNKALTSNGFSRTGYTFLGWSTSSTATTATYTNGQSVKNLTATHGGTVTLYAVWQLSATWSPTLVLAGTSTAATTHPFGTMFDLIFNTIPNGTFSSYQVTWTIGTTSVSTTTYSGTTEKLENVTITESSLSKVSTMSSSYSCSVTIAAIDASGSTALTSTISFTLTVTSSSKPTLSVTTELIDLTGICPNKELGRYTKLLIKPSASGMYGSSITKLTITDPKSTKVVDSATVSNYTTAPLDLSVFSGYYTTSDPKLNWVVTVTDSRGQTTSKTVTQAVKYNIPSNVHAYVPYIWSGSAWVKYTPEIASSSTMTSSDIYVPFIKD